MRIHRLFIGFRGPIFWYVIGANMKSRSELSVMRGTLHTPFWRAAYQSLPETVRQRYLAYIERAERWELALDAASDGISRAKCALVRLFNTPAGPRSAH